MDPTAGPLRAQADARQGRRRPALLIEVEAYAAPLRPKLGSVLHGTVRASSSLEGTARADGPVGREDLVVTTLGTSPSWLTVIPTGLMARSQTVFVIGTEV